MKKQADYIKRIEIKRLWGRKDISWELRPDVNILSGVNGIGKSTILNRSVNSLSALEGGAGRMLRSTAALRAESRTACAAVRRRLAIRCSV